MNVFFFADVVAASFVSASLACMLACLFSTAAASRCRLPMLTAVAACLLLSAAAASCCWLFLVAVGCCCRRSDATGLIRMNLKE